MNNHSLLFTKRWSRRFAIGLVASLVVAPAVLAQSRTYVPPRTGSPPDARTIAGTRGGECSQNLGTELTVLAPYSHTGQTSLTHPTFAWYVPDEQPLAVEFRLYGYGDNGYLHSQPLHEVILQSSQGIMSYTLPADQPGLSVGQSYYWQVAMLCDPAHPSEDLVAGTKIEAVASADAASLWYDLLDQTLKQPNNQELILNLLSELAAIEQTASTQLVATAPTDTNQQKAAVERSDELVRQSQQLMQIVEFEQP